MDDFNEKTERNFSENKLGGKMSVLKIKNVSYAYEGNRENILEGVDQKFERGKFYAIIGKSGAGKSTLLSLLAGLDEPKSGEILFEDEKIGKYGYSYHRKNHIALVFQNYNLIDYLTPLENIRLVNQEATDEILVKLGLDKDQINRNVMKLSGGQQQRVAIARALVSEAPIILADEPTGALDSKTSDDVMELFTELNNDGVTIIVITHSPEIAANAKRIVYIKDGLVTG